MRKLVIQDLKKVLPSVKMNVSLKDYTTFKIGGPAKYFFEAKTKEDLIKAVQWAKRNNVPFFVLGGGSNILAADQGFNGLVIKMQNSKIKMPGREADSLEGRNENSKFKIFCESGVSLVKLVSKSLQVGATGMEWAAGIPGTIGGAICGNAGAFGASIAEAIKTVEALESKNLKIKNFKQRDCKFGYRNSIFKHNKNLIILSAELELRKENKKEIKERIIKNLEQRKKHQPLNFPSAGSIFQNVKIKMKNDATLKLKSKIKKDKNLKTIIKNDIIPAGWLVEQCGLKGKRIGDAQISEKHANFIVNLGGGKAKDVRKLINLTKKSVKKNFGIVLQEEIQCLGFKN